jgi:uncharacterized protein (TIGR02996 family)
MTSEEDFQAALDAHPEDWQTRLVFADWLDERGDPRGPGYRALGAMRNAPDRFSDDSGCSWTWWMGSPGLSRREYLSPDWWELLSGGDEDSDVTREYLTRRAADDAAARAFAKLPPRRRARLLSGRQALGKVEPPATAAPLSWLPADIDLGGGQF